jgi:hypothetical protein
MPKPVVDLVARALAFDRANRFDSARQMQQAIGRIPAEIASMITNPARVPANAPSTGSIASAQTLGATAESSSADLEPLFTPRPLARRVALVLAAAVLGLIFTTVAVVSLNGSRKGQARSDDSGPPPPVTVVLSSPPPPDTGPAILAVPPPTSTAVALPPTNSGVQVPIGAKPPPPPPPSASRPLHPPPNVGPPTPASSNWLDQR